VSSSMVAIGFTVHDRPRHVLRQVQRPQRSR
jgi:hypothetical protein